MGHLSLNRDTAESRFRTLQKRLQQYNALRAIYEEQMLDHVVKEQAELAPTMENSTGVFYMRHLAVKERRWRIVFDASSSRIVFDASSSKGYGPSLDGYSLKC
jgi:hypothetical protein